LRRILFVAAAGLALFAAAAGAAPSAKPALQVTTERAWQAALKVHASTDACQDTIGKVAARAVVRYCLYQSGATHPPCDSINACSVITDHINAQEIGVAGEILPGESSLKASDWKTIAKLPAE
jgi:hypothetical protein